MPLSRSGEPIADIERLLCRVDAGAIGRIGGMQRFYRKRHVGFSCVREQFGDGIFDL
jgi:hypothetical protein